MGWEHRDVGFDLVHSLSPSSNPRDNQRAGATMATQSDAAQLSTLTHLIAMLKGWRRYQRWSRSRDTRVKVMVTRIIGETQIAIIVAWLDSLQVTFTTKASMCQGVWMPLPGGQRSYWWKRNDRSARLSLTLGGGVWHLNSHRMCHMSCQGLDQSLSLMIT